MRLIVIFATPLLATALVAGTAMANPQHSGAQSIGENRAQPALSDIFNHTDDYFQRRFVQAQSLGPARAAPPARHSKAPEDWANAPENWAAGEGGGYVEQLSLHYESGDLSLSAGKYTPSFGVSPELAPSAFSTEFKHEYEQNGRVGFGGTWQIADDDAGAHALSLNSYFLESPLLNVSAWQNSDQAAPAEAREIHSLRHLLAALDGETAPPLPNFSYHLATRYQLSGEESETSELGYVVALHSEIELADGTSLDPLVEYAYFNNGGEVSLQRQYLTFGVAGGHGPWNLTLSYSGRDSMPDDPALETDRQRLRQLMLRYAFEDGSTVDFGHRRDTAAKALNVRFNFPL